MPGRVTLKSINQELARLKHGAVLVKADGYFYFHGKEADAWLDRTVRVPTLSSLSLRDWIGEYTRLKKRNAAILRGEITHRK